MGRSAQRRMRIASRAPWAGASSHVVIDVVCETWRETSSELAPRGLGLAKKVREVTTSRSRPYRVTVYHCFNFTFGAQLPFSLLWSSYETEDGRRTEDGWTGGDEETGGDGRWTDERKTEGRREGGTDGRTGCAHQLVKLHITTLDQSLKTGSASSQSLPALC